MDTGRKAHRGSGWLSGAWEKPLARNTPDVGRGRGSASRGKRVIAPVRSPSTPLARPGDPLADLTHRGGWQACVPQASRQRRSWQAAGGGCRHA